MEGKAIVETIVSEFLEISDSFGHLVVVQLESNVSSVGLNQGNFHLGYGGLQRVKKTIWSVTDYTLPGSPSLEGVARPLITNGSAFRRRNNCRITISCSVFRNSNPMRMCLKRLQSDKLVSCERFKPVAMPS